MNFIEKKTSLADQKREWETIKTLWSTNANKVTGEQIQRYCELNKIFGGPRHMVKYIKP